MAGGAQSRRNKSPVLRLSGEKQLATLALHPALRHAPAMSKVKPPGPAARLSEFHGKKRRKWAPARPTAASPRPLPRKSKTHGECPQSPPRLPAGL